MHEPSDSDRGAEVVAPARARTRARYVLLALPMVGSLIPPIYNTKDPTLIGIPFFYWYLMLWVPLTAGCLVAFYRLTSGYR